MSLHDVHLVALPSQTSLKESRLPVGCGVVLSLSLSKYMLALWALDRPNNEMSTTKFTPLNVHRDFPSVQSMDNFGAFGALSPFAMEILEIH